MSLSALEITIATLLSWMGLFQDGLQKYEQQDYAKAADALSRVILSEYSRTPVEEFSRMYRAECYIQLKVPRQAHEDLSWLIRNASNEALRHRARVLFTQLGGDLARHLPRESARETAGKALQFLQARRHLVFAEYLSGDLRATLRTLEMVAQAENRGSAYDRLADEMRDMTIREVRTNAQWTVELVLGDRSRTLELEMKAVDQRWRFTRLKVYAETGGVDGRAWLSAFPRELHANARTLKRFGEALEIYAADNQGAYPDEIEKLVGYLKEDLALMLWEDPDTNMQEAYRYHSGLLPDAVPLRPFALLVSPKAHGGAFLAWFSGRGAVVQFSDKAMRQLMDALGIRDPVLLGGKASAALRKRVADLVAALQSEDFQQRRAAKRGLHDLGEVVFPLLLKYKNSPDPEVKLTIKEILDGK
jgi:hypothetical protein